MPIRIMHVVDHLGRGGLENGLVNLVEGLDPQRFEHVVYAIRRLGPNAERLPKDRTRVICQGKQDSDSRFQVPALARSIRKLRPEIVHSRNWAAIEAVLAAWPLRSCAIIHSEHGLETDAGAKEPRRRRWFRRLAYELADRVAVVSGQLRDLHARRTGFAAQRIAVIHNGVDSRRYYPDAAARARVRRELGLSDHDFCVGCVGNLLPVKDHMTVLQAFAGLARHSQEYRLLLVGEGAERARLEAFIGEHPDWQGRVRLMGTSGQVPELLNALDAYVLSSLSEGISNSLLEAMSSGVPVVATATGGNPEVVIDGESGLLFPVGDCGALMRHLSALRTNREVRLRLGHAALRRVRQEFSLDQMIRKYEGLYQSVLRTTAAPLAAVNGI